MIPTKRIPSKYFELPANKTFLKLSLNNRYQAKKKKKYFKDLIEYEKNGVY